MRTQYIRPGLRTGDRQILTRVAQFDANSEPNADVATLDADALAAEYARVRERGNELSARDTLTAEQTTELGSLAERLSVVQARQAELSAQAAALQAHRDAFASAPEPVPAVTDGSGDPGGVTTPAATAGGGSDPGGVTTPPAVTASTTPPAVPSVTAMAPAQAPVAPAAPARSEFSIRLTPDGAGALGRSYGEEVTLPDITQAVLKSFQAYGSAAGGGQSAKRAIAQFTRERPDGFELRKEEGHDYGVVQKLIKENRLEGGSLLKAWSSNVTKALAAGDGNALTAAAGWCAPSENLYDLCSLWSMDGMLDLPTATARRGGFNYVQSQPSYATLDAATNFTILTEAQVIADTPKNCAEIPCPTFTDTRLDVAVTCITGSFLQSAGYPEMVETWVDGTLTNHAHKLNENIISRIVTFAGAANVIAAQGLDTSATSSILSAVDLAATDMRYRERMAFNHTFEVILPHWVLVQFRADIVRKNGWAMENASLADAEIVRWFTTRNIRPQFVYDWQDAYSGLATGPGGATDLLALPATVQFLIYPAGAVVMARQDVVTLSNVYDSANLTQNLYTRLFTEEGFNLLYPCGEVRLYTAQACPSGVTSAQVDMDCAA